MKTTKRALFSSVIALILCFSMLVGTTFAWFTDSVESGVNQIIAGNLDIELYNDLQVNESKKVTNETKLFNEITYWEPGVVAYENLTVANLGTLALKYQLSVNFSNATTNTKGETLAKVLKVAFVKDGIFGYSNDAAGRTALINKLTEENAWQPLESFMQAGQLNVTDHTNDAYGIVIYWAPSDIDNDFNNQGKQMSIDLGIKLVATQLDADIEQDSFGPDYDVDAIYTDAVVTNEAEFLEALANAKDYAIIGIKGNVTWTTGAGIGSTPFIDNATTYSLKPAVKHITLLGLTEDATFTALGSGVGAVGIDGGVVTFKNLKIVDQSVSYAENSWEYGYLEFRGNTVFENCEIVNAIMMEGDSATFKNCTFKSNQDSEYAVWVSNGDASFENCTFTGTRGLKMHEAYGSEVGTVVINNNTFIDLSKKPGLAIGTVNDATTVVLTNNEFIGTQAGDQGLYSYETDTDVDTFNFTYENNKVAGDDNTMPDGLYKGADGVYYATNNNGLKEGVKILVAGDTLVVSGDVDFGTTQLNMEKAITVDLNGNELTINNARPVRLTNGASIKNGTINVTTTIAAVVVQGNEKVGAIEDLIINVTTPEGKTTTGIQLYDNKHVDVIRNVTIAGVTQGIEVANGSSVGLIENVKVEAIKTGLQVQQSTIGEIKNSSFYGKQNGVWAQLKGTNDLVLKFTNCAISGGNYGLYMCDEGATIVPDGSAYLTYDEATTFEGGLNAQEFAFGQPGKLVINGVRNVTNAENLAEGLKNGDTVVLTNDIQTEAATTAPYGNKYAFKMDGGVLDGKGKELYMECYGDDYGVMTSGGTIKNITIKEGCRAIMIMYATEDIILDNVKIGGDGVLYPINTGEYAKVAGVDLIVTNSTLAGWTSYAGIESASFTNVKFEQGTYYNNIYGRVFKPYVNTTMTDCSFVEHMNLDLSGLVQGQKITFVNCTVNGKAVTADVLTIRTTDAQYDTELFTVDLPSWATSINDCIVFR